MDNNLLWIREVITNCDKFSEDIDIALAPEAFGMKYIENPTKGYVERLKKKGCAFTSNELKKELEKQVAALGVPAGMVTIAAAPIPEKFPDTDPQTLYLKYPSLYDPNAYISDEVKIEVSVRSLRTPYIQVEVQSLLNDINPNPVYGETSFPLYAVEPRKTFLEKTFLLHEEFGKPDKEKIKTERKSRHLYDLVNMMDTAIEGQALGDHDLYDYLVLHRQWYSRISWIDYQGMRHTTLSFLPPEEILEDYRQDYQTMQEQMIYGEAIPFDDLISKLKLLQGKFRLKGEYKTLEEITKDACGQLRLFGALNESKIYEIPVAYAADTSLPAGPSNKDVTYMVTLASKGEKLVFEGVRIILP